MKWAPGYAWLGSAITLDVAAWFVWMSTCAIARHAFDPPVLPAAAEAADGDD